MKKAISLLLAVFAAFGLCACAQSVPPDEPEETQIVEPPDYVPAFTDAESAAMSAFMNKGRAVIYSGALYTFEFDAEYKPVLAKYSAAGEYEILAEDCVPEFLSVYNDRLYYINTRRGGVIESAALDGSDRQPLSAEGCDRLEIYNGELYFLDADGRYVRMPAEGGEPAVLLQGPCSYPYVFDGHVIYQDGRDECLYMADVSTGETLRLSYVPAYAPVILGQALYATEKTETGYGIYRLDLAAGTAKSYEGHVLGAAAELYLCGGEWHLRYPDADGAQHILPLGDINGGAEDCDYNGYRRVEYVSEQYLIECEYEPNARVRKFVVTAADGTEHEYMAGGTV